MVKFFVDELKALHLSRLTMSADDAYNIRLKKERGWEVWRSGKHHF